MAEQWLSIVEYARTYAISDMTIRRRIKTGKLHAVLKDGKYFIPVPADKAAPLAPQAQQIVTKTVDPTPVRQQFIRPAENTTGSVGSFRETTKVNNNYPEVVRGHQIAPKQTAPVTHTHQYGSIPNHIAQSFEGAEHANVEARALLEFCERSLRSNASLIQSIEDKNHAKEANFVLQLQSKDQEIAKLKQQIEDLQVLIKIMEKKA